jgi:transposase
MEDVLDTYALPLNEEIPVICFDESPLQLLEEVRAPMEAVAGTPRREDYEYRRAGVADVMMICQPAAGLRKCLVMDSRTKEDFARVCLHIDALFPDAKKIKLVCDNLNTHTKGAFYKAFDPQTARRLAAKFEFHYTPKHGSWLNIAELEFAVLGRTVFKKRIQNKEQLQTELDAICAVRNAEGMPVKWIFTTEKARKKMHSGYDALIEKSK